MRLVYYGTPSLAVPPLLRLARDDRAPLLVVTRPDRPQGRGLHLAGSPVKEAAQSLGIPVVTPARVGAPEEIDRLRGVRPDLIVLVAYGQILPGAALEIPRIGALNVHFSILPRHRGAAPIQASLLDGDRETGVTTMWMTEGLDEGPVFQTRSLLIGPDENAGALAGRLAELGAECLAETMDRIERGEIVRMPQDPARATTARKIRPSDARLPLEEPPDLLARRVRAFAPEPGAYLELTSDRLLVLAAAPGALAPPLVSPGTVLALDREKGIEIALPQGSLWLRRVKPSGRKEMSGFEYANGRRLKRGDRLPMAVS